MMGIFGDIFGEIKGLSDEIVAVKDDIVSSVKEVGSQSEAIVNDVSQQVKDSIPSLSNSDDSNDK